MIELIKYEKAIIFATEAHAGQTRKGTSIPYIVHPYLVGMILLEQGCEEAVVTAGILHDTVEDTRVTLLDLEDNFGTRVMELVRGASEPDKSLAWQERKQHTLDYLKEASLEERLIIGADKLHNINSMIDDYQQLGEDLWERFNGERGDQLWYYRGLVEGLCYRQDIPSTINIFTRLKNRVEAFFGLKDE